jgi:drug/metabolite transporter, DME family
LIAAVIWAISSVYYRVFQVKLGFLQLNLLRTSFTAAVLLVPAMYLGGFQGSGFAVLSGIVSLALGDSLFLVAIRKIGASIAAPIVYTYVLLVQFSAQLASETVPLGNFLSAGLVMLGVLILTGSSPGPTRARGIGFALAASLAYTGGNLLLKLSTNTGGSFVTIGFVRVGSAALALAVVVLLTGRSPIRFPEGFKKRDLTAVIVVGVSDLALGSTLLVYSISTVGVALTVILASVSPLLTQVFSKALGKETPTNRDVLGGLIILAAVVMALTLA